MGLYKFRSKDEITDSETKRKDSLARQSKKNNNDQELEKIFQIFIQKNYNYSQNRLGISNFQGAAKCVSFNKNFITFQPKKWTKNGSL